MCLQHTCIHLYTSPSSQHFVYFFYCEPWLDVWRRISDMKVELVRIQRLGDLNLEASKLRFQQPCYFLRFENGWYARFCVRERIKWWFCNLLGWITGGADVLDHLLCSLSVWQRLMESHFQNIAATLKSSALFATTKHYSLVSKFWVLVFGMLSDKFNLPNVEVWNTYLCRVV